MLVRNDQLLDLAALPFVDDKLVRAIGEACHIDDVAASNESLAQHNAASGIEHLHAVGHKSIHVDNEHVVGRVRVDGEVCRTFCDSCFGAGSRHVRMVSIPTQPSELIS